MVLPDIGWSTMRAPDGFRTGNRGGDIREQPVFPHDACELEHAVSPESFAALQRLLPGNKYKGEENQ